MKKSSWKNSKTKSVAIRKGEKPSTYINSKLSTHDSAHPPRWWSLPARRKLPSSLSCGPRNRSHRGHTPRPLLIITIIIILYYYIKVLLLLTFYYHYHYFEDDQNV